MLYRHRNTDAAVARGRHGHFWATPSAAGDHELLAPHANLEKLYERTDRV